MGIPMDAPLVPASLAASLNAGEVVVSDVGPTIPGISAANLPRFLLELARAVSAGSLQPDKLAVAVRSTGVDASAEALGEQLADAIWYAWQEVEEDVVRGPDARARLADAAKDGLKEQLVTKAQLFCVGDGELFEEAGLVVSKDAWRKKEIRSHTKHVYTQRKFNLLREESEGWAKLATLLNQQAAGALTPATAPAVLSEMKALIGYFDLDPNRCFSLLLDAFTQQPGNDAFLGLMPAFSANACAQLLGFHFWRCREDAGAVPPRPARPAPEGLYTAAAKMVRAGYTSLEALWAHLDPTDQDLQKAYEEGSKKMGEGIARIGIISLISAADTASAPLAPPGLGLRREPSGTMGAAQGGADQGPRRTGQTAAALELAAPPYAAPLSSVARGNQKLALLAAFIRVGDWEHAQAAMRWLGALGLADFAVFPGVGAALCDLIGRELQPVYAAACPGGGGVKPAPGSAPVQLPERLLELLTVAGQHLYHSITVLTKLVRTLAAMLASNGGAHPASQAVHEQALGLLTSSVLPAMALVPSNAGLVHEVWAALAQLPYTDRFCLYADLQEGTKRSPLLTAAAKLAETEVRRILRRVTAPASKKEAKATMKPLGRMLAKIMHAAPLPVAEQLIRQVMGMPGMVTSIVESLKYLTPMAFDVMTYAILKQLASPKKKLKDDGVNLEEWYQWLAAFTGLLCKKHGSEVEVPALLQYVANQLKSSESLDLLVLKEMVQTMTGHQAVFDVSEGLLDALAGSDTLIAEVVTQGEHRASDKSLQRASARLLAALMAGETLEQRLAMPLLVLVAQQRKLIVLQSQSTHLKLIAELYDKCQEVCTQYAEFLQHALPPAEYRALLPSMEDLAREYCVDPELVFQFYRPLIRACAPPAAAGPAAGDDEEGEISAAPAPAEGGDSAAAMEEDGQLEAGEVAGSGAGGAVAPAPPPPAAGAVQSWEELEAGVLAMHEAGGGAPWRGMSPALYATFWALQLYDLEVPVARYESTISQLRTDVRITQGDIEAARRDAQRPPQHYGGGFGRPGGGPELALGPAVDVEQLGKDVERAQAALDKLPGELKAQQANAAAVEARLQREKGGWVLEGHAARVALPREFAQHCVLPRMLNSPTDAIYCARFLKRVHQLDVPGFNLLTTINHVMREYGFLVRCCTSREATNFGIFLNEVLAMVERWRSKEVFGRECATAQTFKAVQTTPSAATPAAVPAISAGNEAMAAAGGEGGDQEQADAAGAEAAGAEAGAEAGAAAAAAQPTAAAGGQRVRNVDHRQWLNLCHNWQKKLTDEVFASCLRSGDYMQAKNALLVLNRCVKVYPATKVDASKLIDILAPIRDKDPREDLKTLARMYCTGLEMQMRDKARAMVATREEYAGLPPKKRPARAAASKGGKPAASEGSKPKDAPAAAKEGGAKADAGKAGEARRTSDSSKGPSLPPGLGAARGGRREEPARERERRRDERADGPPPGFGADKLKHAGSTTDVRRGSEQPTAAGGSLERGRGERGSARDDRPPRPGARAEEARREQRDQQQARGTERDGGSAERRALRPDAPAFTPREGGTRLSSGSTRPAEDAAAAGEREAKRARRDEPPAGSGREQQRERGSRERPASDAKAAAGEGSKDAPTAAGRDERPASGERLARSREEERARLAADAGGAGRERGREARPTSGERERGGEGGHRRDEQRDSGPGSKRKREEAEQQRVASSERERERPSGRSAAPKEERPAEPAPRARRQDEPAAADGKRGSDGRGGREEAARGGGRHRHGEPEPEAAPRLERKAAEPSEPADSGGSSGGSGGERGEGRSRRHKDKEKKRKKDRKHKKKDRSRGHSPEAPAAAEEPDSKKRRRDEEPELPARLRGRLGSGGLLGAALKDIAAPEGGGSRRRTDEPAPEAEGSRRRGGGRGSSRDAEEPPERQVREVRRGGRSRR